MIKTITSFILFSFFYIQSMAFNRISAGFILDKMKKRLMEGK